MSLLIGEKSVVSVHYKLSDDSGKVLDSSEGRDPLAYLHGAGNIVPGLEKALTGKIAGDSLQVKVEPAEGYGEINPEGLKVIEKSAFEGVESVEAGMAFEAKAPDGTAQQIIVTLNFDITIVSVREATKEELDHGHTHEHGHSH
jgi:FKBP-type peptidyl-prolyl cis-trans isomerase SlyD